MTAGAAAARRCIASRPSAADDAWHRCAAAARDAKEEAHSIALRRTVSGEWYIIPSRTVKAAMTQSSGAAAQDVAGLDALALYRMCCAMCHDRAQGNIPPRAILATRSHVHIVEVLTSGAMQVHARGFTSRQIDQMARYLK